MCQKIIEIPSNAYHPTLGAPSSKHEAVQRVLSDQPIPIKEEVNILIGGVTIKQEVN